MLLPLYIFVVVVILESSETTGTEGEHLDRHGVVFEVER